MSEYTVVECEYKDTECLKSSLKELGYEFEEHANAQNLQGYTGDTRTQKANIIIRRKHVGNASNDVGFLKKSDGTYQMIISDFDRGIKKTTDKLLNKLKQLYSKHVSLKTAKKVGFSVTKNEVLANGQIKIKARMLT